MAAIENFNRNKPEPELLDYHYGIDVDLKKKLIRKWDHDTAEKAKQWVISLTGKQPADDDTLQTYLRSGERLCEAVNKIKPGTIKKINNGPAPFVQRENIEQFLKACKGLGMNEQDLFTTVNLFEGSNMVAVVNGLLALGGISRTIDGFEGPFLELGSAAARKNLGDKKIELGGGIRMDNIIKGADELQAQRIAVPEVEVSSLDSDVKLKLALKYDDDAANACKKWLEELLEEKMEGETLQDGIKSGVFLCKAINKIKPQTICKIHSGVVAFKARDNIATYLNACRDLGMQDIDLFMSDDLYEGANMTQVIDNVIALSGIARAFPGYSGPLLGMQRAKIADVPVRLENPTDSIIKSTPEILLNRQVRLEVHAAASVGADDFVLKTRRSASQQQLPAVPAPGAGGSGGSGAAEAPSLTPLASSPSIDRISSPSPASLKVSPSADRLGSSPAVVSPPVRSSPVK